MRTINCWIDIHLENLSLVAIKIHCAKRACTDVGGIVEARRSHRFDEVKSHAVNGQGKLYSPVVRGMSLERHVWRKPILPELLGSPYPRVLTVWAVAYLPCHACLGVDDGEHDVDRRRRRYDRRVSGA